LTNGYGAPKDHHTSKWYLILNDLAKMAYQQQKIELRSNGKALRDFIWLGDVCQVVKQLLQKDKASNQVFNLSSGHALPLLSVAQEVQLAYQECFGQTIEIRVNEQDTTQAGTLEVSAEKLQKVVNHQPTNKIKEEAIAIFKLLAK
jgi:UDP-glucose 4-epimerase